MALQEKKAFIQDQDSDMTPEDKNLFLSAKLALAPYKKMRIERIDRVEGETSGWQIAYLTDSK